MSSTGTIILSVWELNQDRIEDAEILLEQEGVSVEFICEMDMGCYVIPNLSSGSYSITISKAGLGTHESVLLVREGRTSRRAVLMGDESLPIYYANGIPTPYDVPVNYIGVLTKEREPSDSFTTWLSSNSATIYKKSKDGKQMAVEFPVSISQEDKDTAVDELIALDEIEMVGMLVNLSSMAFLTGELEVTTESTADLTALDSLVTQLGFVQEEIYVEHDVKEIIYSSPYSYSDHRFLQDVAQFESITEVLNVNTPTFFSRRLHSEDFLFREQWHSRILQNQEAWQEIEKCDSNKKYGDSDIVVAVYDTGIPTETFGADTYPTHPDFVGPAGNRAAKVLYSYDFTQAKLVADNNSVEYGHGSMVAGIIAGQKNSETNEGVMGIAPNVSLIGAIYDTHRTGLKKRKVDAGVFTWFAGLDPKFLSELSSEFNSANAPVNFFPTNTSTGAINSPDIVSNSWGNDAGYDSLKYREDEAFDRSVRYGRQGKGLLVFFAAGNENGDLSNGYNGNIKDNSDVGTHEFVMAVGASSLDDNGLEEVHASYSNIGTVAGQEIEFVAPSHDSYLRDTSGAYIFDDNGFRIALHKPPQHYGVITSNFLHGSLLEDREANMPGKAGVLDTTLQVAASAGDSFVELEETGALIPGQYLIFGDPSETGVTVEIIQIGTADPVTTFPSYNRVLLNGTLANPYAKGTDVSALGLVATVVGMSHINAGANTCLSVMDAKGIVEKQKVLLLQNPGVYNLSMGEVAEVVKVDVTLKEVTLNIPVVLADYAVDPGTTELHVFGGAADTTFMQPAAAGGSDLVVKSTHGFQVGHALLVGVPGDPLAEARMVEEIVNGETIRIAPITRPVDNDPSHDLIENLYHDYAVGKPVVGGRASYINIMGGTSAACPMASGIAALVLSVNSNLSWLEVREIMRETAIPIDVTNLNPGNLISATDANWKTKAPAMPVADGSGVIFDASAPTAVVMNTADTKVSAGDTTIEIASVVGTFEVGQIIVIDSGTGNEEVRVITGISDATLRIDPLRRDHDNGKPIKGGRKPHYSPYFGHGRLDAFLAVKRAFSYSHDHRDLVIRDFLYEDTTGGLKKDDGKTSTDLTNDGIHSPDIWLTNSDVDESLYKDLDEDEHALSELPSSGIINVNFTGTTAQLNDLRIRGIYTGNNSAMYEVKVVTGGTTTPNQIKWRKNGGIFAHLTDISAADQELELDDGLWISFGSALGHDDDTIWEINVEPVTDRYIYARVHNTGGGDNGLKSLDAWVRYYVAFSDGNASTLAPVSASVATPFYFPTQWSDQTLITALTDSPTAPMETYCIGRRESNVLVDHEKHLEAGAIDPQSNMIVKSHIWPADKIPSTDPTFNLKPYLLVQVSPFDGPIHGLGAEHANNLSYREILFADFDFKKNAATALDTAMQLDGFGTPISQDFIVTVHSNVGKVTAEKLQVEFIRTKGEKEVGRAVYQNLGSGWVLDDGNGGSVSWVTIAPPTLTFTTTLATSDHFHVSFSGSFDVDSTHDKLLIRYIVNSSSGVSSRRIPIGAGEFQVDVYPAPKLQRISVFADLENSIQQPETNAYGPVDGNESTQYRVTSLHTSNSVVNAYAALSGFVFLQRDATNPNTVNLIIRPLKGSNLKGPAVKYFVYRGLRLTDFLAGTSTTDEKLLRAKADSSPFIDKVHTIYQALNSTTATPPARILGFDPANQTPGMPIDSFFYNIDFNYQLAYVGVGTELGTFYHDNGHEFGFEVMLQDTDFAPDIQYLKESVGIIDVTTITDAYDRLVKREQILGFLDPVAFYGSYYNEGVISPGPDLFAETLFNKFLLKFHSRHRIYLDIRNEKGHSLLLDGGLLGEAPELDLGKQILVRKALLEPIAQAYGVNEWPISFIEHGEVTARTHNLLHIQMRVAGATAPYAITQFSSDPSLKVEPDVSPPGTLIQVGTDTVWTKPITYKIPNVNVSGVKRYVSGYINTGYFGKQVTGLDWSRIPREDLNRIEVEIDGLENGNAFNGIDGFPVFRELMYQLRNSSKTIVNQYGITKIAENAFAAGSTRARSYGALITYHDVEAATSVSVFSEELFHAYQILHADQYTAGVDFNREFEAKVFKMAAGIAFGAEGGTEGMEQFFFDTYVIPDIPFTLAELQSAAFRTKYQIEAEAFRQYNITNKPGAPSYHEQTMQDPKVLEKLFFDFEN